MPCPYPSRQRPKRRCPSARCPSNRPTSRPRRRHLRLLRPRRRRRPLRRHRWQTRQRREPGASLTLLLPLGNGMPCPLNPARPRRRIRSSHTPMIRPARRLLQRLLRRRPRLRPPSRRPCAVCRSARRRRPPRQRLSGPNARPTRPQRWSQPEASRSRLNPRRPWPMRCPRRGWLRAAPNARITLHHRHPMAPQRRRLGRPSQPRWHSPQRALCEQGIRRDRRFPWKRPSLARPPRGLHPRQPRPRLPRRRPRRLPRQRRRCDGWRCVRRGHAARYPDDGRARAAHGQRPARARDRIETRVGAPRARARARGAAQRPGDRRGGLGVDPRSGARGARTSGTPVRR